jgi:hypothetical protein
LFDDHDQADVDPIDVPDLPTERHRQLYRLLCANAHRDEAGRLVTWWPQAELAAKLGIKPRQLRNLLADLREPGSDPRHPTTRPPGLRLGLVKVEPTTYRDKATGRHRLGGNLYVLVELPRQQAMAEEPVSPAQVNRQWDGIACLNEEPPASEERWVSTPTVSSTAGGQLFDVEDLEADDPRRWVAPQHAGTVAW